MEKKQISQSTLKIEVLKITKKLSPNNNSFLLLFFFFKFLGIVIFSGAYEPMGKTIKSPTDFFRALTIYGTLSRPTITMLQYEYIVFILYFIIIIPGVLWIYILTQKKINSPTQLVEEKINLPFAWTVKIIAFLYIIIVFVSQHLIEFLCFPFCILYLLNNETTIESQLSGIELDNKKKSLILRSIALSCVNMLFIIIINLYVWFYFKWFNYPFLSNHFVFKEQHHNYFLIILVIVFNCQGFHYYSIFNDMMKTFLSVTSFCLSLFLLLTLSLRYIERIPYNYLINICIIYSFTNPILSSVSYFTKAIQTDLFIWKNGIIILLIIGINYLIYSIQNSYLNKKIVKSLYLKHKNVKGNYLFQLIYLLKQGYSNTNNFALILELIEKNKLTNDSIYNVNNNHNSNSNINGDTNEFNILTLKSLSKIIKNTENIKNELNKNKRKRKLKDKFNAFLILIETEIINVIASLYRNKKLKQNMHILLLYCDFVFYFKMNYAFSLYLIQQYGSKMKEISFEASIDFFSLKNYILNERECHQKRIDKDKSAHRVKFSVFLEYFQIILDIKHILLQCCDDYHKVINIKNYCCELKHKKESVVKKDTLEKLFLNCVLIEDYLNALKKILIDNFHDQSLKNPEICYLLHNFYKITHRNTPNYLMACVLDINEYDTILNFDSDYLDKDFEHPLIFKFTSQKDSENSNNTNKTKSEFKIFYISYKLASLLGYKPGELIEEDIHLLIPKVFAKEHSRVMKKTLFLTDNIKTTKKKVFLITKEGYYIRVEIGYDILNSLTKDTLIICDIRILSQNSNCYLLVTDIETNVITMSENFNKDFHINFKILNRLNITVSNFFSINKDKLQSFFQNQLKTINKEGNESMHQVFHIFSQSTMADVSSTYETESSSAIKTLYNNSNSKDNIYIFKKSPNEAVLTLSKQKSKVTQFIQKMKKQLEELEYEEDWIKRINPLEKNYKNKKQKIEDTFEIKIKLNKIGNMPYYMIKVFDKYNITNKMDSHILLTPEKEQRRLNCTILKGIRNDNNLIETDQDRLKKQFNGFQKGAACNQNTSINTSYSLNDTNTQLFFGNNTFNQTNNNNNINKKVTQLTTNKSNNTKQVDERDIMYFNQKYNQKEFVILIITIIFVIVTLGLFIFNVFYKTEALNSVEDFFDLVFGMIKLKEAVLESSLLILTACFTSEKLDPNPYYEIDFSDETLKMNIFLRSVNMFDHFNIYSSFLAQYFTYPKIRELSSLLKAPMNFTSLNPDFTITTYESTLEKELHNFHFYCSYQKFQTSFQQCNVISHFLGKDASTFPIGTKANEDEILLYYVTHNVVREFLFTIDEITNKANDFVIDYCKKISASFLAFNIFFLVIGLVIPFTIILKILLFKSKMTFYLKFFLNKNDKTQLLEKNISLFKALLISFEEDTCLNYEMKTDVNNNQMFIIPMEVQEEAEPGSLSGNKHKRHNNTFNNNIRDLKHSSNQNKTSKKKITVNKGKEEGIYESENEEERNRNNLHVFSLNTLRISFGFISMCLIIFLVIMIINIVIDIGIMKDVELAKEMAITYLDRTPSINEMLLYYRVSVLYNNPKIYTIPFADYEHLILQFTLIDISVNINDEQFKVLEDSGMTYLKYKSNLEFGIIQYFEISNANNVLPLRKAYSKSIDLPKGCCKNFVDKYKAHFDNLFETKFLHQACMTLEGGHLDQELASSIQFYVDAVLNDYVEFMRKKDRSDKYLISVMTGNNFISAMKMMIFIYNIMWQITVILVDEDVDNLFNNSRILEGVFQLSLLAFTGAVVCISHFVIYVALKKKTNSFSTIIVKIRNSLE